MIGLWQLHRAFNAVNKRTGKNLNWLNCEQRQQLKKYADGYQTNSWTAHPYRPMDAVIRLANRVMRLYKLKMTVGEWNRVINLIDCSGQFYHQTIKAAKIDNEKLRKIIIQSNELLIPEVKYTHYDVKERLRAYIEYVEIKYRAINQAFEQGSNYCILGTEASPCRICGSFLQYDIKRKNGTLGTVWKTTQESNKGWRICKSKNCSFIFNTFRSLITSNDELPLSKIIKHLASAREGDERVEQTKKYFVKNNGRFTSFKN